MKTKIGLILIMFALLSGCYESGVDEEDTGLQFYKEGNSINVVIMGDSRMWQGGIWEHLPYTIWNYAYRGTTTQGVLNRIDDIAVIPDIIIVGTGVNDISDYGFTTFGFKYYEMMNRFYGIPVICIEVTDPAERFPISELYNNFIQEHYPDSYLELNVTKEESHDGVHFKEEVYERISEDIENRIESML